ncbi:MAG: hypothetical protein ACKO2Z_28700, partial [Sphaerospermopsis kisseleviana]
EGITVWEVEEVRSLLLCVLCVSVVRLKGDVGKLKECDRSFCVFSVSLWFVKKRMFWKLKRCVSVSLPKVSLFWEVGGVR